jgi:hypothetical protein
MIDFQQKFYTPKYKAWGIAATLTPSGGEAKTVTVINLTKGVEVSAAGALNTIRPAADIRVPELISSGITRSQLRGAVLSISGKDWSVRDHESRPSPRGEDDGEIRLLLTTA